MLHILPSSTFDVQWFHTSSIFLLYLSYISVMIELKKKKVWNCLKVTDGPFRLTLFNQDTFSAAIYVSIISWEAIYYS